ncbi:hypothetical protein KKH23_02230 [Patescibacteria group bacterium]|nr:hypothetical protein [Patescibacteria group bacterium]MBU0777372.1 hypothetical protein [Patescibacteria group bacterium]MBU0846000.1 hypothetical protein [Patescibacteria group bacterium]MBU0922549.1 hypothetical protein [Patescibacteria group bacterium]MBU1066518.1 hypothetical protein [Patescibacteria group bacterium]
MQNIQKYNKTNLLVLLKQVRSLCYSIFPLIWASALLVSIGEALLYPGVTKKYLLINPLWVYFILIAACLFSKYDPKYKKSVLSEKLNKINLSLAFLFGLLYLSLMNLEKLNYSNFVFSKLHVHPAELKWPLFVVLISYALSRRGFHTIVNNKNIIKKIRPEMIIITLALMVSADNLIGISSMIEKDISFMLSNPLASYDLKMSEKVTPLFYEYTSFIKTNVPEESTILIPPQGYPWPQTGNSAYLRYFLYPRKVLNGEEYLPGANYTKNDIDYVLIAWGETIGTEYDYTHGWPKFDVAAEEIIYITNEKDKDKVMGNYVYEAVKDKELWGVIKITK